MPKVVLNSFLDATEFTTGLLEIVRDYFVEGQDEKITQAMREMFAEMTVAFTKRAITSHYPKVVTFKPYEAKLIFLFANPTGTIRQKFPQFINPVHQNLIA